jgi:hypothetical protein
MVCWLSPGGRPCPPYIGRRTRSVDWCLGRFQHGNISLVCLHHGRLIRAALICLECLVLRAKLSSRLDKVVWGIFWKVFRRSCGPPTRSVAPTNRSAGLLVGRTHLSGTAVSLVSGDPGVPMSHTDLDEAAQLVARHVGPHPVRHSNSRFSSELGRE